MLSDNSKYENWFAVNCPNLESCFAWWFYMLVEWIALAFKNNLIFYRSQSQLINFVIICGDKIAIILINIDFRKFLRLKLNPFTSCSLIESHSKYQLLLVKIPQEVIYRK